MKTKTINQHCVKCGYDDAYFSYHGNTVDIAITIYGTKLLNNIAPKNEEVLILTCNRCGYQWTVEPLDSN